MNETARAGEPQGVAVATLTPMTAGLEPDFERFAAHCRRMLDRGANLLAVLGTTGEANSLGVEEKLRLLDALGDSDIPGETLLPGTGTCSIADTVILTRKALEVGSAGVVMLPPFYYKGVSDAGLHAAYEEVIQRVGDSRLRIYFYNFPFNSGVPISHDLIEGLLAAYPGTVAGIKDSSGDLDNMLAMCRRFPGFGVFCRLGAVPAAGSGRGRRRLYFRNGERHHRTVRAGAGEHRRRRVAPAPAAAHDPGSGVRRRVDRGPECGRVRAGSLRGCYTSARR